MVMKLFYFSTGILLILSLVTCSPVTAGEVDPSLASNELAIRQAHLSWMAEITAVQMNAAITFVGILYSTDTTQMDRLYQEFLLEKQRIPTLTSKGDLDLQIISLLDVTTRFRNENLIQMANGKGKEADLKAALDAATKGNPYIENQKKTYWDLRANLQMKDFATRIRHARTVLNDLKSRGYDTDSAQRTLDVIASKEPVLRDALVLKSDLKVQSANDEIRDLSVLLADQADASQEQVPKDRKVQFLIDQANRATGVAEILNNELVILILNIGPAEPILAKTRIDLAATQHVLDSGRMDSAATSLLLVKQDFRDLAVAYRGVATSAAIPRTTADTLMAMSILLDNTADSMAVT